MNCDTVKVFVETLKKIGGNKITELKSAYELIQHEVDHITELDSFSTYILECDEEELESIEIGLTQLYQFYIMSSEGKKARTVISDDKIEELDRYLETVEKPNFNSFEKSKKELSTLIKEISKRENLKIRLSNLATMISIVESRQKELMLENNFNEILEQSVKVELKKHISSKHDLTYTISEALSLFIKKIQPSILEKVMLCSIVLFIVVKINYKPLSEVLLNLSNDKFWYPLIVSLTSAFIITAFGFIIKFIMNLRNDEKKESNESK